MLFRSKAEALRQTVEKDLWNTNFDQFMDRYKVNNPYVHYWDFIRGPELAGYVPWSFELPDHDPKYSTSWNPNMRATILLGKDWIRMLRFRAAPL